MPDKDWFNFVGLAVAAFIGLLAGVVSKRTSSVSETQNSLNESFKSYMIATDGQMKELRRAHQHCEDRMSILRRYVAILVRTLRSKGIAVPILEDEPLRLTQED